MSLFTFILKKKDVKQVLRCSQRLSDLFPSSRSRQRWWISDSPFVFFF